jgi:hypothetical protein
MLPLALIAVGLVAPVVGLGGVLVLSGQVSGRIPVP